MGIKQPAGMSDQEWAERLEQFSFHPDILAGGTALPRRITPDSQPVPDGPVEDAQTEPAAPVHLPPGSVW